MNKYIITIIKNIFSKELPKPMGRWRIEHNNIQMNNKIDLSNEDHCGPCGYSQMQNHVNNKTKEKYKKTD